MNYLVFDSEAEANAANTAISETMGFTGSITASWAEPRQRLDSKWVFAAPPIEHTHNIEEYQPDWFQGD